MTTQNEMKELEDQILAALNNKSEWWRIALQVDTFHTLQQAKYGKAAYGRKSSGWSIRDTAKALKHAFGWVCEEINLAALIHSHPQIRECKDRTDAIAFLKKVKDESRQG